MGVSSTAKRTQRRASAFAPDIALPPVDRAPAVVQVEAFSANAVPKPIRTRGPNLQGAGWQGCRCVWQFERAMACQKWQPALLFDGDVSQFSENCIHACAYVRADRSQPSRVAAAPRGMCRANGAVGFAALAEAHLALRPFVAVDRNPQLENGESMLIKKLALGLIPVLAVGTASAAFAASTRTLNLALATDNSVPSGNQSFDCSRAAGHRAHVQAFSEALNASGGRVSAGESTSFSHSFGGTTQSLTLHDGAVLSGGPITQHRARLQAHLVDTITGEESTTDYVGGNLSGSWAGHSETSHIVINTSLTQTGPCQNRTYYVVSFGSTP